MKAYNIPTADFNCFSSHKDARQYISNVEASQVVIKVDGLAAGKGVVLPANKDEAQQALSDIMIDGKFGEAGTSIVIEEYLKGDEISVLTFTDGKTFQSLPAGQDHKRIFDGNQGPNTGGMGVYAPVSFVTPEQMRDIESTIIRPTLEGLENEGKSLELNIL